MEVLYTIATFLYVYDYLKTKLCPLKPKQSKTKIGESHRSGVSKLYLLLQGQGGRVDQQDQEDQEAQAVQGCHLVQGGQRVPGPREGGVTISTNQNHTPSSFLAHLECNAYPWALRATVSLGSLWV